MTLMAGDGDLTIEDTSRHGSGRSVGGLVGNESINGFGGMILLIFGRGVGINGRVRCEV